VIVDEALLEHLEELGCSALCSAVLEVEDWRGVRLAENQAAASDGLGLLRTFFNAIFLVSLELFGVFVLVGYALDALVVVVLPA
jgi:hypothetical protein